MSLVKKLNLCCMLSGTGFYYVKLYRLGIDTRFPMEGIEKREKRCNKSARVTHLPPPRLTPEKFSVKWRLPFPEKTQ